MRTETTPDAVGRVIHRTPPANGPGTPDAFARDHAGIPRDKLAEKVTALEAASRRLTALVHLGHHLASESDPQRLVFASCREAHEIVGARIAVVGIFADSGDGLRQLVKAGPDADVDLQISSRRQGILGTLLAASRPVRLSNLDRVQAAALPPPHRHARSFLGDVVKTANQEYGWLYFVDKLGAEEFNEEDERVAALLSVQLGIAYENACRLERMRQHVNELERRVTERTEALLRSNADLAQFAYVASHDLQEPLRMVASCTDLLAKRYCGRLDPTADQFIAFACEGAKRMQEQIRDLLAYSRLDSEASAPAVIPLDAALGRALANLRQPLEESGASVSRSPLPVVAIVEAQFVQVFQNLVGNAIKFRSERAPEIRIAAEQIGEEWVISVSDNGIGIAPEFSTRIFTIFERLHSRDEYPGTGMGLAICKRVVERHGGQLWVRSEQGRGATFFFTVPADGHATAVARIS